MSINVLFDKFPHLENDILYTKMMDHDDDEPFVQMMMNPNCFKYTPGYAKETDRSAKHLIDHYQRDYQKRRKVYLGVYLKSIHQLIGYLKVFHIDKKNQTVDIAYRFHESFWHHGYAEMSCRLLIKYLTRNVHVKRIYATTMAENKLSNHILNRCGFVLEKTIEADETWKDYPIMLHVYCLNMMCY